MCVCVWVGGGGRRGERVEVVVRFCILQPFKQSFYFVPAKEERLPALETVSERRIVSIVIPVCVKSSVNGKVKREVVTFQ